MVDDIYLGGQDKAGKLHVYGPYPSNGVQEYTRGQEWLRKNDKVKDIIRVRAKNLEDAIFALRKELGK